LSGEIVNFDWSEPPPIGCGVPYDHGLKNCAYEISKTGPKNPLDRICSPDTIRFVDFFSFLKTFQPTPYPSGVNDEKGFPKDGQVKAPRGFGFSFWSLSS
jgi:hypothetical protein